MSPNGQGSLDEPPKKGAILRGTVGAWVQRIGKSLDRRAFRSSLLFTTAPGFATRQKPCLNTRNKGSTSDPSRKEETD